MAEAHYLISDAARQVDVETHVLRYWEDELGLAIPRNDMGHRYYTDYHIRLFCQIRDLKDRGYQLKAIKNALNKMSGAMEDITVTEDLMEEEMKAAWKEGSVKAEIAGDGGQAAAGGQAVQAAAGGQGMQAAAGRQAMQAVAGGQAVQRDADADTAETEFDSCSISEEEENGGSGLIVTDGDEELRTLSAEEKMIRFREIMNHIIGQAMEANMTRISREITEDVSGTVSENVTDKVMKEVEYLLRISDEKEEERFRRLDETIRACQNKGKGRAEAAATKVPLFKKKKFGKSGRKLF